MRLVLASGSPRRRDLLASLGLDFEVAAPHVDESHHPDEHPAEYVERIARDKAGAMAGQGKIVLAADTTVVFHGHVMGKPAHPAEARNMLGHLSGDAHTVLTGVAVATTAEGATTIVSAVDTTVVRLLPLTEDEIAAYVDTGEPMDKAGAYALQGLGAVFIEGVDGSPSNVIGLPLHVASRLLATAGIHVIDG